MATAIDPTVGGLPLPGGGAPARGGVVARVRGLRPVVLLAFVFVALLLIAAIAPSLLTKGDPLQVNLGHSLQAPSLEFPFGTDQSGRSVYTRVIYGARESILIGLGATAVGLGIAALLGVAAGIGGKWVDNGINRLLEVLFSFPILLFALFLVAIFGSGVSTQILAVGIASSPGYARMIRAQVLQVKGADYVIASRALGHPPSRTLFKNILPNAFRPLVVLATLGVGQSIVWASALSFLGLGVAPPAPEWGAMLDAGKDYIQTAWWLELFPGAAIVATTLAASCIGRYLQRRIEGETY
ncbi:MAG: peptide ABC transporter permease [Solirubrobacterales bacterium 70-9]|nr:MAG: peptide ABC transporter permease [Solirubrobacterales bacterium 70-9]